MQVKAIKKKIKNDNENGSRKKAAKKKTLTEVYYTLAPRKHKRKHERNSFAANEQTI